MGHIPSRLEHVSRGLSQWIKCLQREKHNSLSTLRDKLKRLGASYLTDDVLSKLKEVRLAMNKEIDQEEIYWEQRERANWLQFEDNNSSFFHRFATHRKRGNQVK